MTTTSHFDRKEARKRYLPVYDELYKAYPLHQNYGGGFNAFLDLMEEGVDPQLLLEKATAYARNTKDVRWVPHLRRWLLDRRFEDEDLFTDQFVTLRNWFIGAYRRADAAAVTNRFGFLYTHPPVPSDEYDPEKWHEDQKRAWIGEIANHILHGKPLPE